MLGTLSRHGEKEALSAIDAPTIGIVHKGTVKITASEAVTLEEGSVVFVSPNDITLEALAAADGEIRWAAVSG